MDPIKKKQLLRNAAIGAAIGVVYAALTWGGKAQAAELSPRWVQDGPALCAAAVKTPIVGEGLLRDAMVTCDPAALTRLGHIYNASGRDVDALNAFNLAAAQGYAPAVVALTPFMRQRGMSQEAIYAAALLADAGKDAELVRDDIVRLREESAVKLDSLQREYVERVLSNIDIAKMIGATK